MRRKSLAASLLRQIALIHRHFRISDPTALRAWVIPHQPLAVSQSHGLSLRLKYKKGRPDKIQTAFL